MSEMEAGIERPVIGKLNYNTWIGYFVAAGVLCWVRWFGVLLGFLPGCAAPSARTGSGRRRGCQGTARVPVCGREGG